MTRIVTIENSALGDKVELRDLTVRQWRAIQKAELDDDEAGLEMLSYMLYVDGENVGKERLYDMPMFDVLPLLGKVNDFLSHGEAKND